MDISWVKIIHCIGDVSQCEFSRSRDITFDMPGCQYQCQFIKCERKGSKHPQNIGSTLGKIFTDRMIRTLRHHKHTNSLLSSTVCSKNLKDSARFSKMPAKYIKQSAFNCKAPACIAPDSVHIVLRREDVVQQARYFSDRPPFHDTDICLQSSSTFQGSFPCVLAIS